MCVCVPVELQYLCDRAEDDVDVSVAQNSSVGVQGCCERLVVHLQHSAQSPQINTLAVVQLSGDCTSPI